MKPKPPTEADLLTLVQNGFNSQLPKDRAAQAAASEPVPGAQSGIAPAAEPGALVPMVRITLAVPEDLRFRLKLAMMSLRRKSQCRMTQDEYCAKAIAAQLDLEEDWDGAKGRDSQLAAFLGACVKEGGLTKAWMPKAKALLEGER